MILYKQCYLLNEEIEGKLKISGYDDCENIEIEMQICKVYNWYDASFVENVIAKISGGILYFKLSNLLESGLYAIIAICIKNKTVYGRKDDTEHCKDVFAITEKTNIDTVALYQSIARRRELDIQRPKLYEDDNTTSPYDIMLFVKNLQIENTAYYDVVQVYPYEYLKLTGEVNYINDFIKNITNIGAMVDEKVFETSVPAAVFIISNIMAHNDKEAESFALKKAQLLNSIFTSLLHSHGSIFAMLTFDKKERKFKTTMLNTRYKGNLLHLAENGFTIRHYFKCIDSTESYMRVYLKLLNDAQNENDRMMKYYRWWNILEGLAMRKNYSKEPMKKWSGEVVRGKKGVVLIGEEALSNVFELVRQNFSGVEGDTFVKDLNNVITPKEFLSICYQRRNCCAHRGECCERDTSICLDDKSYMVKCRESNIVDDSRPAGWEDSILRKLQDITFQIILNELRSMHGKAEHCTSWVDAVIK